MIRKIVNDSRTRGKFRIKRRERWKDSIGFDVRINYETLG